MNYMIFIESFSKTSFQDDVGIVLILATPIILLVAFIFLILGFAKKSNKAKMFRVAVISFIVSGVTALVGMGTCGWFS